MQHKVKRDVANAQRKDGYDELYESLNTKDGEKDLYQGTERGRMCSRFK